MYLDHFDPAVNGPHRVPPPTGPNPHPWREALCWELRGRGVEFGPGCHPMRLGPAVQEVVYCDSHSREEFARDFPEASHYIDLFPEIDLKIDFDRDDFTGLLGAGSRDFVVASHTLEHLMQPLRFLDRCHDVLKDGGVLYLGLPDKRRTFDRHMPRTRLAELLAREAAGTLVPDAAKVIESHRLSDPTRHNAHRDQGLPRPLDPDTPEGRATVQRERDRSIHVNHWVLDDMLELFEHLSAGRGRHFRLLDGVVGDNENVLLMQRQAAAPAAGQYDRVMGRLWSERQERLAAIALDRIDRLQRTAEHHADGPLTRGLRKLRRTG